MPDASLLKFLEKKKPAQIIEAILGNDLLTVLVLAEKNPSILEERNHMETLGGTVLHLATKIGHKEIVETIIRIRPSLVGITNPDGDTPLHLAARWGHASIITSILASGQATHTTLNRKGETPFTVACRYTHPDVAALILEELSSITLLEFNATIIGIYKDLARRTLEKFPNLAWEMDGEMSTPLHLACNANNLEMVKMLLEIDEKLAERANRDGLTPLHLAAMGCSAKVLNEFSEKAPRSFDILSRREETVFHLAAKQRNTEAFIFMAESSDRSELLYKVDKSGCTVLHTAAFSCCHPVILYIIYETTIDLSAKTIHGSEAINLVSKNDDNYHNISYSLNEEAKQIRNPQYRRQSWGTGTTETGGKPNRERDMHAEALRNARNTITIVAVLIASLSFTGGLNPPGGVYQEGPLMGKSIAGRTAAFKIFLISNNIALFTSLCIVVLLVSIIPYRTKPLMNFLVITHWMMWVAVASMAIAYLAAAWLIVPHSRGTTWLFYTILAISIVTLGSMFVYLGCKLFNHMSKKTAWRRNMSTVTTPAIPDNWTSAASDRGAAAAEGYYIY